MSLKEQLKQHIFNLYPAVMSSRDVEEFAKQAGFLAETGRKRVADLRDEGFVSTEIKAVKLERDGKTQDIAFHKAIPDRAKEIYRPKFEYVYDPIKKIMVEKRVETIPEALKQNL